MYFNDDEYRLLQTWEGHFKTMIESGFCRAMRTAEIDQIDDIRNRALGVQKRTNKNCGVCISSLIREVAPLYYADKAERAESATSKRKTNKESKKTQRAVK